MAFCGAHGAVLQLIRLAVFWAQEKGVVCGQVSLDHHIEALGERGPMFLKVLAPLLGLGHDEKAAAFSGKFVHEVQIHMFCGFVLEISLDCGVCGLDLGVGRSTYPAGWLLVNEHILILVHHGERRLDRRS